MTERSAPDPWRIGLQGADEAEEMIFALPSMNDELHYTINVGNALVGILKEKIVKKTIRMVPVIGNPAVDTYEIIGANLFDDAMIVMLETVADSHTVEAAQILRQAMAEFAPDVKANLHGQAASQLHSAHAQYQAAIKVRIEQDAASPSWKPYLHRRFFENHLALDKELQSWNELIELHAKAASRQIAIALIYREIGGTTSVQSQVANAEMHFMDHYRLRGARGILTIAEAIAIATSLRMGGVDVTEVLAFPLREALSKGEIDRVIEDFKAIGTRHIAATRAWDGEGRTWRTRMAYSSFDDPSSSLKIWDKEHRIQKWHQTLDQVQAAIDDLSSLQRSGKSFDELALGLTLSNMPATAPTTDRRWRLLPPRFEKL